MRKFLLAGIATAITLAPGAQAMEVMQGGAVIQQSSDFQRDEGRQGWGRGQERTQPEQRQDEGERSWRRGGEQRRGNDNRGGWRNRPNPEPQSDTPRPERPRWEGRTRDDQDWRQRDRDNRGSVEPGWERRDDGRNYEDSRRDDRRWNDRDDNRRWEGRRDDYRNDDRRWEGDRNDDRRWGNNRGYDRRDDSHRWNRGWRNDRRYDWRGHRHRYGNAYRHGRYQAPDRYHSYRRFNVGIYIGRPFYSNRYWINDPWQYRLPEAYGPYRWVRYYDDVLLIDLRNGYVVDVIHGFFW
ncbi:MAG: RcnB family protein [Sphingorhabdus sp.]